MAITHIKSLRKRFPQIDFMNRRGESYLDSASSSLKLDLIWPVLRKFYETGVSNVHRGQHHLSLKATKRYERARSITANFLNAREPSEIVFTRSTTEGLNLLAESLCRQLKAGDEILVTEMEHHSNFLPWQDLCKKLDLKLKIAPVREDGSLDMKALRELLLPPSVKGREKGFRQGVRQGKEQGKMTDTVHKAKTEEILFLKDKGRGGVGDQSIPGSAPSLSPSLSPGGIKILSITHVSNVTGVINPLDEIIPLARLAGAKVVVDAAQSVSFLPIDVKKMDCDFLVFSGHKIFAPSGIGVIYGKKSLWEGLPPWQKGGGTVYSVSRDRVEWAEPPFCFEAGTPFIEGALALAEVLSFLKKETDFKEILTWERALALQAEEELKRIPGLRMIGPRDNRSNILSFVLEGVHSSDLAFVLTKEKLALRAGHHCCMPLMDKLGLKSGTARASFSVYNREEDCLSLKKAVLKATDLLL